MNLKDIVNRIGEIVASNPIYNYFGEGSAWEIDSKTIQYPAIWIDAENTPHNLYNNVKKLNIQIYFFDLVEKDEDNELQIKSDTLETANDFVNFLMENRDDLDFYVEDGNFSAQCFTEKFNDEVSGCVLSLTITTSSQGTICKNIFSL